MSCECDRLRRQIADMQAKLQADQHSRAKYHKQVSHGPKTPAEYGLSVQSFR